jgi:chalcone isomerase-like protein
MKTTALLILCLFVFSAFCAADVAEPKTNVSFPETRDAGGKSLMLSGVGLRTKMMFKVYAGALYLDPSVKTDLAPYKAQAAKPSQALYDAICSGPFSRMFVLHFVRDVDKGKITESFEEGLRKSINTGGKDAADVKAFLSASGADMKEGQEMSILIVADEITVTTPSGTATPIHNASLAKAICAIWLGKDPISDDLKQGMVSRLPSLL